MKKGLALLLAVLIPLVGGCWDWRELETLAVVTGVGIDLVEGSDRILLTVQLVEPNRPQTVGNGGGGGDTGSPTLLLQSEGDTIFEAIRNLSLRSTRRPFFSHARVFIIGEEAARRGIMPYVDFIVRDPEPRRTALLVVAQGQAWEVLEAQTAMETISGLGLENLHTTVFRAISQAKPVRVQDYLVRLVSPTTNPITSRVRIDELNQVLIVEGMAFFSQEGELLGYLDRRETRGLLWALGEVGGTLIQFDGEVDGHRVIGSLDVLRINGSIRVSMRGGRPSFLIQVEVSSKLGSLRIPRNVVTPQGIQGLAQIQAETVIEEIQLLLDLCRTYRVDLLGLGDTVYRAYPREWKSMRENWSVIWPDLPIEIEVRSFVEQLGLMTRPIPVPARVREEGIDADP